MATVFTLEDVMSAKHTPGPWRIEPRHHCYAVVCDPTRNGEYPEIVFVEQRGNDECGSITARKRTDDELRANANLIAAAPDLLAACQRMAKAFEQHSYPELQGIACDVFAVIARATGT